MGRPKKEDRGAILSERLGGIVVSKWEREGITLRVGQINREAEEKGYGKLSVASYIRRLIVADLQAHGCLAAGAGTAAELDVAEEQEPEPPPPPAAPAAAVPSHAPVEPPAPVAQPEPKPAAATPAKPKPAKDDDPDAVRELVKECFDAGMTMKELAKRVGFGDHAKFTHFKNANPERGKLSSEKLRTVAAACRRWQAEQDKAAR